MSFSLLFRILQSGRKWYVSSYARHRLRRRAINKQSYFSLNRNEKAQLIYLRKRRQFRANEYSENHKKLRAIGEETVMIDMAL